MNITKAADSAAKLTEINLQLKQEKVREIENKNRLLQSQLERRKLESDDPQSPAMCLNRAIEREHEAKANMYNAAAKFLNAITDQFNVIMEIAVSQGVVRK